MAVLGYGAYIVASSRSSAVEQQAIPIFDFDVFIFVLIFSALIGLNVELFLDINTTKIKNLLQP